MSDGQALANGTSLVESSGNSTITNPTMETEVHSPIIASDAEYDSTNEQQPPTRSPTASPPPGGVIMGAQSGFPPQHTMDPSLAQGNGAAHNQAQGLGQNQDLTHGQSQGQGLAQGQGQGQVRPDRTLHVPASLRRNNSSFVPFSEIPTLPAFLNNYNLSQYLQSFNDAGANDDVMPMLIDFDEDELKTILDAVPMLPFHVSNFKRGIRHLREQSRMGSMHFDNSQSSFMHPEPHAMLQVSHSQFFQTTQPSQHSQQQSQHSQTSHHSQSSHPQLTRGYSHQHGLHRQPSQSKSKPSSSHGPPYPAQLVPTPTQVLSGMYQTTDVSRSSAHQYITPSESSTSQRHPKDEHRTSVKRRRSYSGSPPVEPAHPSSSPVLPGPSSFNSNSSSSWSNSQAISMTPTDIAARELIMHQAMIYGKHSSRSLTKYEAAINKAAQSLALEDPRLLSNKGDLWTKAKAKLLKEEYDYKRGKSRSKLPEASQQQAPTKANRQKLIQRREANASNNATARQRRMASLVGESQRKTSEREDILAQLLRIESPDYRKQHPDTFEMEAKEARDRLAIVEAEQTTINKELGSLRNKERKHQWYEKRKKMKGDAGTDADADEEGGGGGTDTTMDPEGESSHHGVSQPTQSPPALAPPKPESTKMPVKAFTWKMEKPMSAPEPKAQPKDEANKEAKTDEASNRKRKDIFRNTGVAVASVP
ncbi:hypothetical protein BG005_002283 [Podila minutissima]|nr:hypothetical protein BG005_002283 [Podila minutissima]